MLILKFLHGIELIRVLFSYCFLFRKNKNKARNKLTISSFLIRPYISIYERYKAKINTHIKTVYLDYFGMIFVIIM